MIIGSGNMPEAKQALSRALYGLSDFFRQYGSAVEKTWSAFWITIVCFLLILAVLNAGN